MRSAAVQRGLPAEAVWGYGVRWVHSTLQRADVFAELPSRAALQKRVRGARVHLAVLAAHCVSEARVPHGV